MDLACSVRSAVISQLIHPSRFKTARDRDYIMPILFRASLCMGTNEERRKKRKRKIKRNKIKEKKRGDGVKTAILYIHWIAFLHPLDLHSNNLRLCSTMLFYVSFKVPNYPWLKTYYQATIAHCPLVVDVDIVISKYAEDYSILTSLVNNLTCPN